MLEVFVLLIIVILLAIAFKGKGEKYNHPRQAQKVNYETLDINRKSYEKLAGDYGEEKVRKLLSNLTGNKVNGYITSENIVFDDQNFQIDFLVLVPNIGFVLAEVKNYSGTVYCTAQREWKQVRSTGEEKFTRNPSKQVLRTRGLLKKLLGAKGLDGWPIKPVVIFANGNSKIMSSKKSDNKPQTPVIRADMFDSWLEEQGKNSKHRFSRKDFDRIYSVIKSYEKPYSIKSNTHKSLEYPKKVLYSNNGKFPGGFKVLSEVGPVSSSGRGFKNTRESLLNQAEKIGANAVIITNEQKTTRSRSTGLPFKITARGRIYPRIPGTYRWNEVFFSGLAVKVARFKS